jgi:hypothetical protein
MNDGKFSIAFSRKLEITRRRQKINSLLRRAIKGNPKAKEKLSKDFGIKLYSSKEIEQYQKNNPNLSN